MKKIKVGVVGAYRGNSMIQYCKNADNAELVAICDNNPEVLEFHRQNAEGKNITFYADFDDFIKHDMDAVVLANFAHEHAPLAIKSMKNGKHVFSEVLPCQNVKEAIELIEAVEETGLVYAYGENYCYLKAPYEMRKLYKQGVLGEFEYGECEYLHNCEPIWHRITYGIEEHWRNSIMYATFYCTHSLGPIIHITGLRPVSVIGIEGTMDERVRRVGAKGGPYGIEMVTLENGGVIKSLHGQLYKGSVWYSVYGSKGRMESGRADSGENSRDTIHVNCDDFSGEYGECKLKSYIPSHELDEKTKEFGHGGTDFYSMYNFIEKIKGSPDADTIDVYEALDMFLPGLFAHISALDGGKPKEIPNLRDKKVRDQWRCNVACTDPKVAKDLLLPLTINGTPEIDKMVYDRMKELWRQECEKDLGGRLRAITKETNKLK